MQISCLVEGRRLDDMAGALCAPVERELMRPMPWRVAVSSRNDVSTEGKKNSGLVID